jgi:TolB-like protein
VQRLAGRLSAFESKHPWPRRVVIAVVAVSVAFLATTEPLTTIRGTAIGRAPDASFYAPNRVAVMYFDVAGDTSEIADVGDYLTDEIIHRLSSVDTLQVVSSNGVRRFRRKGAPVDTIVKALHVGTIVTGRIVKFDNTTTVLVEFADASGVATGGSSIHFNGVDATAMVDSVAQIISDNLRKKIGDDIELGRWRLSDNAEAGIAFARALSTDREFDRLSEQGPVMLQTRVASSIGQLERAMKLDPDWIEPLLLRAQLGWDMSFYCTIATDCDRSAAAWMQEAQDYANRALDLEPGSSHALELRGRTAFYAWVFGFEHDPGVIDRARADLEQAVAADERNAVAWKTLSAVRHELNDLQGAYNAARQALLADEFLRERPEILWRLFETAFELDRDPEASQACREIAESPSDDWQKWQAAMCTLQLQAWSNDRMTELDSASHIVEPYLGRKRDIAGRNGPILGMGYAAVLARAGFRERAQDMIRQMRIEATSQSMPETETALFEAAAWARLGEVDNAVDLAEAYLRANPSARRNTITRRWFRGEIAKQLAERLLVQDGAPQLTDNR